MSPMHKIETAAGVFLFGVCVKLPIVDSYTLSVYALSQQKQILVAFQSNQDLNCVII